MSILKLKTVLMLVFTTIITGCASTVTHNYAHFQPMSQEEAIRLVSELGINYGSCLNSGKGSFRTYSITADKDGFKWVIPSFHVTSSSFCGSRLTGSYLIKNYINHGYYTYPIYRANFADISAIQMDRRPGLVPGAPSTYEILLKHNGRFYWHMDFSKEPNKYKEYLSAFLVLCPNVK